MNEFARMIYAQWRDAHDNGNGVDWGDYDEAIQRIYDFLNTKIADELESAINQKVWNVEENAFVAGFGYACKCLSDGKIELKGGAMA